MIEPGSGAVTHERRISLLLQLPDRPGALNDALKPFARHGVNLTHIESRPARGDTFDFFVDCEGERGDARLEAVICQLERTAIRLMVLDGRRVPWFPRDVADLDLIANNTLDAGTDLHADHPGFSDPDYRARRAHVDVLARRHRHGDAFPVVKYSPRETATWKEIYDRLAVLHRRHACSEYLQAIQDMERHCGYGADHIPQGRDVSAYLESRSGFRLRPVAGLMSSRDFLNGLAFRVFFATQYIRHHSKPFYTPEPDVCHELIGHAPMLASPAFADLSQEIGLASLGASDADIERLARCYWHSVEFGLVEQHSRRKAYGAGLLSSVGELEHGCAVDARSAFVEWDPVAAADQDHPITCYQPVYFVAGTLDDAKARMAAFCRQLPRPFYARYNPTTQRIWVDRAVSRQGC